MGRESRVVLDTERTDVLWKILVANGDLEARNALIEMYLPWCRIHARALYARRGGLQAEVLEYIQIATVGLIDAIDAFDPARGVAFEAYALPRIRGAILNGLRTLSEKHEQVSLQKRLQRQRLESLREGRGAQALTPQEELFERLARVTLGLAIGYMLEGTNMVQEVIPKTPQPTHYDSLELKERRELIHQLVDTLPLQERRVIRYHYFQGLPFTEVAALLELTKGRISQIHRQALEHLHERAKSKKLRLSA